MRQTVKLLANDELPVPSVEVEADHLYEAAALGLKHFHAMGRQLRPDATVDVASAKFGAQLRRVKEVIDWLRTSEEGRAFVEAKRLHLLLDSMVGT
jgi:hypothetical protein